MGLFSFKTLRKVLDQWGRYLDRSAWKWQGLPPQENPDDTTSDEYWDISNNPHIIAGMQYSDISYLFVSARGLEEKDTGASYPAQLIYTTPELASQEIFDLIAWQFDEEFQGGFQEVIRATDNACKSYGRTILEYVWHIRETDPHKGKAFVKEVFTRDPEQYRFDINGKSGIYKNNGFGIYEEVDPLKFQSYAYNPLFNNPYGTSINLPLKPWVETFNKVFGYWRHALEKAGLGSWGASYPNSWLGKDAVSVANRESLVEAVKKIAAGTWSIYPEGAKVESFKLAIEAQAFLDWYTSFCEVVSLTYTGTTTALKEAEFGSKAAKESTDVRSRSNLEKFNAGRISNFWTWQFIPMLVNVNFPPDKIRAYPSLQLIKPELIMPTTPEDQAVVSGDGQTDETEKTEEEELGTETQEAEENTPENASEFEQAASKTEEGVKIPPAPIPASYHIFPDTTAEPPIYQDVVGLAREELSKITAKNYPDVTPEEAANTFTIKKLRSYPDALAILQELKAAIMPTLSARTEEEAWRQYYAEAVSIFGRKQIAMSPQIRADLIVSFRQARQNAFGRAILKAGKNAPDVIGFRLETERDARVRPDHKLWQGVTLRKDDPLLDRLQTPMDFECRCDWLPVYEAEASQYPFTPPEKLPRVMPGDSYKYYAQPKRQEDTGVI